jgi:hypothetical protein
MFRVRRPTIAAGCAPALGFAILAVQTHPSFPVVGGGTAIESTVEKAIEAVQAVFWSGDATFLCEWGMAAEAKHAVPNLGATSRAAILLKSLAHFEETCLYWK